MIQTPTVKDSWLAEFEQFDRNAPEAFRALRKSAYNSFATLGFPTLRDEEWRYTNVSSIANTAFETAAAPAKPVSRGELDEFRFGEPDAQLFVVVNGRYEASLSARQPLPAGVVVCSLAEAMKTHRAVVEANLTRHAKASDQPFTALNTAFLHDGLFVHVPRGAVLQAPIHLLFLTVPGAQPTASHPRLLLVAEENSQATLVETHASLGDAVYFTNAVAEFVLAENAIIDHYKVERESDSAYHTAERRVILARSGNMSSHTLSFGGGLVRNDVNAWLGGEGANCMFNGLYVLRGTQHVDNHLRVEHAQPHCNSWEYYKGILGDQSRGVFTGRIIVHEGAQKTDAKQSNANLLLSRDALIDTKPQLEILADDVKCTHGATVGQLDDEAIFYLRTRGVSMEAARSLLIYAFAGESIGQVRVPKLRDRLQDLLAARLPHGESLTFGRPYDYSDDFVEIVRSADRRRHTS